MSILESINGLSHHAYGIIGGDFAHSELLKIFDSEIPEVQLQGNPDFFNRKYQTFTIDDARELKSNHEIRPTSAKSKKIFVIAMDGITIEAQNALLKLLEEPAYYAHFFIIIPSAHLLLPTVKSRISMIGIFGNDQSQQNGNDSETIAGHNEAKKFMDMSVADRLEYVKTLTDEIKDEKKTRRDAVELMNSIQAIIYKGKGISKGRAELEAIEVSRKYMNDTSASIKMLLEYIALTV